MARSRAPAPPRQTPEVTLPYTDHLRKLHDFATRERSVRTGGVPETLTNLDIMIRKQFEAGVSGKTLAQRDYIQLALAAEASRRQHVEAQCQFWTQVKLTQQQMIEAAETPAPRALPHPDDIRIDWTEGVSILGPTDDEDWARFDQAVRLRDALFIQQAMEDCLNSVRRQDRPTLGAPGLMGFLLNELSPPSLRLSETDWIARVDRLSRLSKRDVLKRCRAAWRALGVSVARGKQFGSRAKLMPMLNTTVDLVRAGLRQKADPRGFEDALHACARAMTEFRTSAPPLQTGAGVGLHEEVAE
jgi:hypothetical protein